CVVRYPDKVAGFMGNDRIGKSYRGEQGPELGDADLNLGACRGGWVIVPHGRAEPFRGNDPTSVEQQHRQHNPLASASHRYQLPVGANLHWPQQVELHGQWRVSACASISGGLGGVARVREDIRCHRRTFLSTATVAPPPLAVFLPYQEDTLEALRHPHLATNQPISLDSLS